MQYKMEFLMLVLCVIPAIVTSISISPNGNSPTVKMIGGMMVDVQKGFLPMTPRSAEGTTVKSNYDKSRQINVNATKLALNERYRRLIPYMTFYYANDLATPPTDTTRNVEVEKAQIVEARDVSNQRQPRKLYYPPRNIPRYQGNRLTQYNIASANPTKIYYKDGVPIYQIPSKVTPNFNPLVQDHPVYDYESARIVQKTPGPSYGSSKRPFINLYNEESPNIRYYLSEKEQSPKYKLVPYEQTPPVKVSYVQSPAKNPYEQTQGKLSYEPALPVKISYHQYPLKIYEQPPTKPESAEPVKISYDQHTKKVTYNNLPTKTHYEQSPIKVSYIEQPVTVVNTVFEPSSAKESFEQSPVKIANEPVEVGYKPPVKLVHEVRPAPYESPVKVTYEQKVPQNDNIYEPRKPVLVSMLVPKELYVKPRPVRPSFAYDNGNSHAVRKQPAIVSESYYEKQRPQVVVSEPVIESGFKPIVSPTEYSTEAPIYLTTFSPAPAEADYEVEKQSAPLAEPSPATPNARPNYYQYVVDQPAIPLKETSPSAVTLASLLNSLQVNKSIPKPITRENVASSIQTLLQVLNSLRAAQSNAGGVTKPLLSTPKPFISTKVTSPEIGSAPEVVDPDLHEDPYLAEVHTPSQHLDDDYALKGGQRPPSSQQFPLQITSDDEGGTPGTPGVDYPVLSIIPQTSFDCKTQRYKGFFADTETRCQVWHYCDLNGGQASFLCPNGTIFSQAGLTCDWWFNVRCDSTTQLYVLNESLYKYILPHSPKFPEDYSGPLVDKYLTLKFKEMEEEFKKNKSKNEKTDSDDDDDDDEDDSEETNDAPKTSAEMDKRQLNELSEASVIVETPGTSGKVERLRDE